MIPRTAASRVELIQALTTINSLPQPHVQPHASWAHGCSSTVDATWESLPVSLLSLLGWAAEPLMIIGVSSYVILCHIMIYYV